MSDSIAAARPWFDPRLEVRPSPIHGSGLFARQPIRAGELLVVPGEGVVYTRDDWRTGTIRLDPAMYNEAQIDEDLFRATPIEEDLAHFFNHSCDPNFWGDVARRDIGAGEEITTDDALCIAATGYRLEPCRRDSPMCRGRVTGNDRKLPNLQWRYRGHFVPFIERRMRGQAGA